jgi:hypothetical protein
MSLWQLRSSLSVNAVYIAYMLYTYKVNTKE